MSTYAGARLMFDADSHIMELPDFFQEFADADIRAAMPELDTAAGSRIGPMIAEYARTKKHSAEEVAAQVALGEPAMAETPLADPTLIQRAKRTCYQGRTDRVRALLGEVDLEVTGFRGQLPPDLATNSVPRAMMAEGR